MAKGRFVDDRLTPQNLRALWDRVHALNDLLTGQATTIQQQAATITSLQSQLSSVANDAQQALITAGKATSQTSTTNPSGGGGGTDTCDFGAHPDHYQTVVDVIADLIAHGEDLSGPCGSFLVVNTVVQWLRPSEPEIGIIHKPSGTNCNNYSIDALMYNDGVVVDILINADNAPPTGADPQWGFAGCRDVSDWRDPV